MPVDREKEYNKKLRRILSDNDYITYRFFHNRVSFSDDKTFYVMVDDRWEDPEMNALTATAEPAGREMSDSDGGLEETLLDEERKKDNETILEGFRRKYVILSEYDGRTFQFGDPAPVLHNVLSAAVVEMKLGEGILDFIYADFDTPLKKSYQVARRFRQMAELFQKEGQHAARSEQEPDSQLRETDQYSRYLDTLSYVSEASYQSLYSTVCPPVFASDEQSERIILMYGRYLVTLQQFYREALDFCFSPDLFPETLGTLMPHERYSLFLAVKGYIHAHDRSERFILSQTHRGGTVMPYGMSSQELSDRVIHFQLTDAQRREMAEFSKQYHVNTAILEAHLHFPSFINVQYGFSSVEEALELEFTKVLEAGVTFRKCKRCGKFFIMKGNYDTNYCDRIAEGSTRTCQELAAQENYQKKMADNAAIPMYNKYYKRYAARVKVRQIKEADFKRWKYEALSKRNACTDGIITLEEYETWLEGCFPNRKKKEKAE